MSHSYPDILIILFKVHILLILNEVLTIFRDILVNFTFIIKYIRWRKFKLMPEVCVVCFFWQWSHTLQRPRATCDRGLQTKRPSLWRYMLKITVDTWHQQVKTVVIGDSSFWESGLQSSDSWDEAVRMVLITHEQNTKVMRVIRYNVIEMAGLSCEDWN